MKAPENEQNAGPAIFYELAELSDIFADAAMLFLDMNPEIHKAVERSLSPEEKEEQRRLFEGRSDGSDHLMLAVTILSLNENIACFVMRHVGVEVLAGLVPAEQKSPEISRAFAEWRCPALSRVFAP